MIHIKYCIKCGRAFDTGTNHKVCGECRRKKERGENEKRRISY